jgi:hypothetical protein
MLGGGQACAGVGGRIQSFRVSLPRRRDEQEPGASLATNCSEGLGARGPSCGLILIPGIVDVVRTGGAVNACDRAALPCELRENCGVKICHDVDWTPLVGLRLAETTD